ncbi:Uncharacterized protein HZ326_10019 [Fusarium oxysporum f. sp. albedinis]|nr:Uncharacterized protein HZ326_10019 [Fusarium oxysporum f. sp. albedinis]
MVGKGESCWDSYSRNGVAMVVIVDIPAMFQVAHSLWDCTEPWGTVDPCPFPSHSRRAPGSRSCKFAENTRRHCF